jgi:endonuclease/exonuclease/phosphatase (EEP) superfamily protein YafD
MTSVRRRIGWALFVLSLLPLALVWCAYIRYMDHCAVFTIPPIWFWAAAGFSTAFLALLILRNRVACLPILVWIGFTLTFADEAKVLRNLSKPVLQPGPPGTCQNQPVIRVASMNCAVFEYGSPAHDIARWYPDIVLLQDSYLHQTREISLRLFGAQGHFASYGQTNGVVSRWPIVRQTNHPVLRNQQVTIQLPDQTQIEVVNLHLQSAATDLSIWHRATWTKHRVHRAHRIHEINGMLTVLANTTPVPMTPVLLGGDFNAPATDVVHKIFSRDFQDSFLQAGRGWGNTYHRRFPILRIDMLYHTFHFTAVRARAIESAHSDHRMVLVDYIRN